MFKTTPMSKNKRWPATCVNPHMRLEVVRLRELPRAHRTRGHLLAGVGPQVLFHRTHRGQAPPADQTPATPRRRDVRQRVLRELRVRRVHVTANAAVDNLPQAVVVMPPHMLLQQLPVLEPAPARVASVLPVRRVSPDVRLQTLPLVKRVPAHKARVRAAIRVHHRVDLEPTGRRKRPIAHATRVPTLRRRVPRLRVVVRRQTLPRTSGRRRRGFPALPWGIPASSAFPAGIPLDRCVRSADVLVQRLLVGNQLVVFKSDEREFARDGHLQFHAVVDQFRATGRHTGLGHVLTVHGQEGWHRTVLILVPHLADVSSLGADDAQPRYVFSFSALDVADVDSGTAANISFCGRFLCLVCHLSTDAFNHLQITNRNAEMPTFANLNS